MPHSKETSPVAVPTPDYLAMAPDWHVIDSLLAGTRGMRDAGEEFLPKEPEESLGPRQPETGETRYDLRRKRSFLFDGYGQTIKECVARPFAREVTTRGTLLPVLEPLTTNADLAGSSLTTFLRAMFQDGANYGIAHVLVEFQNTEGTQTAADELEGRVRPYFVRIPPQSLIGWRYEHDENGAVVITQMRWAEVRREADGPYGENMVNWIRVLNAASIDSDGLEVGGTWEEWREDDEDENEYRLMDSGPYLWPGRGLPIYTAYFEQTGIMSGSPPMLEMAWKNIEHWQRASDYSMAVRFALLILITATGLTNDEQKAGIRLGHGAFNTFTNHDAKLEFTEATGGALEQGRKSKDEIKEEMEALGLRPFMRKAANTTATSQRSNDDKTEAPIQSWVREINSTALQAFKAAAKWLNLDTNDDFRVEVFNDFKLLDNQTDIVDALIKMRSMTPHGIDHETFLEGMVMNGVLPDETDIEEIIARIAEEQQAALETFGLNDPLDEDDDTQEDGKDDPAQKRNGVTNATAASSSA